MHSKILYMHTYKYYQIGNHSEHLVYWSHQFMIWFSVIALSGSFKWIQISETPACAIWRLDCSSCHQRKRDPIKGFRDLLWGFMNMDVCTPAWYDQKWTFRVLIQFAKSDHCIMHLTLTIWTIRAQIEAFVAEMLFNSTLCYLQIWLIDITLNTSKYIYIYTWDNIYFYKYCTIFNTVYSLFAQVHIIMINIKYKIPPLQKMVHALLLEVIYFMQLYSLNFDLLKLQNFNEDYS